MSLTLRSMGSRRLNSCHFLPHMEDDRYPDGFIGVDLNYQFRPARLRYRYKTIETTNINEEISIQVHVIRDKYGSA